MWTAPPRPPAAQAIHDAAEADCRSDPRAYSLDPDDVVARALALGVESPDDFVEGWRGGLEQFCSSVLDDGRLGAFGRRAMRDQAASKLAFGAKVAARLAGDADRSGRQIERPIVIVGGWRTGTTFLFRLLATDPRLRAPLPVDLTRPWKVADMSAAEREAFLARLDGQPNRLHELNPALRTVHDHGPRLAEECVLALGADVRSWGLSSTVRLERYSTWLADEDLGPSYRAYRQALQLLDEGDGRRFLLKAPAHTAELPTVAATFPGAVVVQLHRDVVETIASGASLFAVFRSTYSDHVDPVDVGRFLTDQTELWLRRADAFRDDTAAKGTTIVDVAYSQLVASPAAVVARVYAAADLEPPADVDAFIDAYHRAAPRHAHGAHRYAPEDFGLDPAAIRERFAFLAHDV